MTLAEIIDVDGDRLAALCDVSVQGRSLMRREVLLIGEMVDAVEEILQLTERVTEEELAAASVS